MSNRRNFPKAVKLAAFKRANGRCEECTTWLGPGNTEYDHVLADGICGEPTLENCAVVCKTCHSFKTRKHDIPAISRAKRLHAKHSGAKPKKRPWSKYRRKMDGTIVLRDERNER